MDIVRRPGEKDPEAQALVRGSDQVGGAAEALVEDGGEMLLAVTRGGYGKRVCVDAFPPKGRGGRGMIAIKFKNDSDELVALTQARTDDQVLFITQKGTAVRQSIAAIPEQGRAATGVQLQRLDPEDSVASAAIVPPIEPDDD